jgi:hypothetical protein
LLGPEVALSCTPQNPQSSSINPYEIIKQPFDVERAVKAHDREYPPEETPYHVWFDSNDVLPSNLNEDILVFYPERKHHELARSFVLLQNCLYRRDSKYPVEHFHWMRFRGYNDQNAYPE